MPHPSSANLKGLRRSTPTGMADTALHCEMQSFAGEKRHGKNASKCTEMLRPTGADEKHFGLIMLCK